VALAHRPRTPLRPLPSIPIPIVHPYRYRDGIGMLLRGYQPPATVREPVTWGNAWCARRNSNPQSDAIGYPSLTGVDRCSPMLPLTWAFARSQLTTVVRRSPPFTAGMFSRRFSRAGPGDVPRLISYMVDDVVSRVLSAACEVVVRTSRAGPP